MFGHLEFGMRKIGAGLGLVALMGSLAPAQQWENVGSVGTATAGDTIYNNFAVNTAGKYDLSKNTCNNTDPGTNPGDLGCATFTYRGQSVSYATVRGNDGKIWLQQNLGSSQVATSVTDVDSYGDLFQWGRWDDGHQLRNSATSSVPSLNSPDGLAGSNSFMIGSGTGSWWSTNATSDAWTAKDDSVVTASIGADPCKAVGQDWKMPSQADWTLLVGSETIINPASAYASTLKMPASGYRSNTTGGFTFVGQRGYYWSADTASTGGKYLYIGSTIANPSSGAPRGQGAAVRCIKETASLSTSDIRINAIGIYPNPTRGILNVKADSKIENVNIFSIGGQKMKSKVSDNQVDLQELPKGIYIIELTLKNGQKLSDKIIKN